MDQASQRLFRENVPHGVLMNGHWNKKPYEPVQVCSIDTLIARGLRPEADLIIIDEAHMAGSEGYKTFLSDYPDAYMVPVTATPYVDSGLRHLADTIVHPIKMLELVELGYLVKFRYFAPSGPDLSGVRVSNVTKDFVNDELETAMSKGSLTGDIIKHWKELALNRPTIVFAVNIHHSQMLTEKFKQAGIACEHCDADTTDKERQEIIDRLQSGETKVVCNVGILCTGVDIPCVSAIVNARPTKSLNLYIQQSGRGTRPFNGKNDCLILDHAGNIERHGLPTDEPDVDLDGKQVGTTGKSTKTCPRCFCVYRGVGCPECDFVPEPTASLPIEEHPGQLVEMVNVQTDPILRKIEQLLKEQHLKGYKRGWAYHKLLTHFPYEKCEPHLPEWFHRQKLFAASPFKGFKR